MFLTTEIRTCVRKDNSFLAFQKKKQSSNWLNVGQQSTNILKTPKGIIQTTYARLVGTLIFSVSLCVLTCLAICCF